MVLETLLSGLGIATMEKPFNLVRQRNEAKLRTMIQEELAQFAHTPSITVINIHIRELIEQIQILSGSGLSPSGLIEATHAHTLPALLSAEMRGRLGLPTSTDLDATPSQ